MLLYICRHGQTDHNVQGIIQGHLDTPLNDHGRFEAQRLAVSLSNVKFDEAYTSPLSRARETAELIIAHHPRLELRSNDLLKERGLGSMEGRRRQRGESAPADAESTAQLFGRIQTWLNELLSAHETGQKEPDTQNILVVSHGAWISNFFRVILSGKYACTVGERVNLHAHLLNTCVSQVRFWQTKRSKRWVGEVVVYADLSHLQDVDEPDLEVADDIKG